MSNTFNLLRSPGGIDLVPEVCLRVAEHAIDEDPKAAAVLLGVSKVNDNLPLQLRVCHTDSASVVPVCTSIIRNVNYEGTLQA